MNLRKLLFIFVLICIIFFLIFYYIFCILGNNKSRNQEEIVDSITNDFQTYEADIEVTVISNKTENVYEMKQKVTRQTSTQEILSPENVKGLKIELESNHLRISNAKLNVEKIYQDYGAILNNAMFLNVFVEDYHNHVSNSYEENGEIILETILEDNTNTYAKYKELHLDKKSGKPKKLIMKDNTQKTRISIKYNDIQIQ